MNEEEKEAIEAVKRIINYEKEHMIDTIYTKHPTTGENLTIILNLIEKLGKEIAEYKHIAHKMKTGKLTQAFINKGYVEQEFISKDKIKQIINKYVNIEEHLKFTNQELFGEDLKNMIIELLEENNNE